MVGSFGDAHPNCASVSSELNFGDAHLNSRTFAAFGETHSNCPQFRCASPKLISRWTGGADAVFARFRRDRQGIREFRSKGVWSREFGSFGDAHLISRNCGILGGRTEIAPQFRCASPKFPKLADSGIADAVLSGIDGLCRRCQKQRNFCGRGARGSSS